MTLINMNDLLIETCNILRPQANHAKLQLLYEYPEDQNSPLMTDALRVQQILINLISNAAKFSKPGSTIRVRLQSFGDIK